MEAEQVIAEQDYLPVRRAAIKLASNESKDTRALAEAVLGAVPHGGSGGRPKKGAKTSPPEGGGFTNQEKLTALAIRLERDQVVDPHGDPYTVDHLETFREVAMAWKGQWQDEAAYRTHQEAMSPNTVAGKALIALCRVARAETVVRRPEGLDPKAWADAKARVEAARAKDTKWLVAANTLRVAVGRQPNVPGRAKPPITREEAVAAAKADPEVALAVVKATVKEPEIAAAIIEDDESRWALNRADSKRDHALSEKRKEELQNDFPELATAVSSWGGQAKLNTALEALRSAHRLFSDSPAISDKERKTALVKLGEIRQWANHLTALMEKRDPFQEGLEELLRNEA